MLDPVSLEIIWQRLVSISDEMDNSTIRTSFSTIVGESHDFGCVLMDEIGNGLSQAKWSPPQFCTMLPRTTRIILEKYKLQKISDGDVFITNAMKEDPPAEKQRYFNDTNIMGQTNTMFTLVDMQGQLPYFMQDQIEKPSHVFVYRETFENRFGLFRGGLSLTNTEDGINPFWLHAFATNEPKNDL